jgi:hypothetical protein
MGKDSYAGFWRKRQLTNPIAKIIYDITPLNFICLEIIAGKHR